jgi:tetratricopeptide (TPR) repeat protein
VDSRFQRPALPNGLLRHPDIIRACALRDFRSIFELVKFKAGIYPSQIARACDLTPGRVGDVLSGRRSITGMDVIERIADGLRIPDELLGLAARDWERPPDMESTVLPFREPVGSAPLSPPPVDVRPLWSSAHQDALIDPAFLAEQISTTLPSQYRTANLLGARHVLDTTVCNACRVERMQYEVDGSDLEALLRVGARVTEFLGWLYQDLGDFHSATYWSDRAMEWSQQIGDDLMAAYVLFRKSNQATSRRNGNQAVGFARAAQRQSGVTRPIRALAAQQEAQGHALLHNSKFALIKFDEAHELAADQEDVGSSATLDTSYCTPAYIEIQRANCLIDMGRPDQAAALFETELKVLPALYRNDQAVYLSRLARAYVIGGEPEHGMGAATKALAITHDTESLRALAELSALDQSLEAWPDLPATSLFRERFRKVSDLITTRPDATR